MSFKEKGLAFVEIVMALVVLAILATTAIPSFVSDRVSARQAAVEGVAGSLGSASAINYAVRIISESNGIAVTNCVDVVKTLEGSLGAEYKIVAAPIATGTKTECTVVHQEGEKATFVAHGIS